MPSNPLPQPRTPPWNWAKAFQSVPIPGWPGSTQSLPAPSPDASAETAPLSAMAPCPRCATASDALAAALSLIGRMARSYDFSPDEIDVVEAEIRAALERMQG